MSGGILTTKQVAELFGVVPQTVIVWARSGKLAHHRTLGGHRRFLREDVDALLAQSRSTTDAA